MNKNKISIPSGTPICNPRTGVINQEWRLWFDKLYKRTGGSIAPTNAELAENVVDHSKDIEKLNIEVNDNTQDINDLNNQVNDNIQDINILNLLVDDTIEDVSNLSNKVENNIIDIETLKNENNNNIKDINNIGSGAGVFKDKSNTVANLKSLVAGDNIVIDTLTNDNEIIISSSGGGSSVPGVFDIEITGGPIGPGTGSTTFFTVKGGYYWDTAKIINNASRKTVNDFTVQGTSIDFNQTYYIYYDTAINAIQFRYFATYSLTGNARLLYILETDGTKINKVTDYRSLNIFIRPKTEMMAYVFFPGSAYNRTFNISRYNHQNQVANNTLMTAASARFPRFVRVELSMMCINPEHGYLAGEEAEYVTGDGLIWGKPYKLGNTGTITAMFGPQTKIWSTATSTWENPGSNLWAIVCKATLEYV